MRTLENLISDKKYKNHNFKIGSINGSSFWIATHNSPKLKSKIIELYEKHRKQEQRARLKTIDRLKHLDEIYETRIKEQLEKGVKNKEKYIARQNKLREIERRNLPKKIKLYEYDIATPFLQRQVKETCVGVSPDEQPCLIVYVVGNEMGKYWTIKEYEKENGSKN